MTDSHYMSGFGNHFATEAVAGALPQGQNSPQKPPYGLYAEQLSGSAFTAPRATNKRSWLYRMRPSVCHKPFEPYRKNLHFIGAPCPLPETPPSQMRWGALPLPRRSVDFVDGMVTMATNGDAYAGAGLGVHMYVATADMVERVFYSADGELLMVPQQGALELFTELGMLNIKPGEIAVIPRGIKFKVMLPEGAARGYVCENYGQPFRLPDLGPIGSNGLANPRDFLTPKAAYEELKGTFEVVAKFGGQLWQAQTDAWPLNVVAWHGNYAPYKYDLSLFNTVNSVSFDHTDPSVFTVLTAPSDTHGVANVDFVIFPPRWMVAEHTFRPPYFHRNVMSEFMGLIHGVYDGKEGGGFEPGGCSIHNCMSGHGPDAATVEKAANAELAPTYLQDTLAFMFESRFVLRPTLYAQKKHPALDATYWKTWQGLASLFKIS